MGQRSNDAALKGAQINPKEEECARDTVHTVILMTNLQRSPRVLDLSLIRLLLTRPNQRTSTASANQGSV